MESNLRQRDHVAHPASPDRNEHNFDDSESRGCCGSSAQEQVLEEDGNHRPQSTAMTLRGCSRRCKRMNPGSISNLCSATLGAGALSLPFAISLTGIVLGVLLLILSAYLTIVSIDVIIEACVRTQLFKYEDVSVRLVGKRAGRVLEVSLLIFCFGTAVAYIVAVGDILDQGLRSVPHLLEIDDGSEGTGWSLSSIYSRERIMILFWALVMFPLSLQRHVEALEKFSSLGVLSIIFLVIAAVIHSISHGDAIGHGDDLQQQTDPIDISSMLWPKSFWDVIQAFPIIIFAFSCQVNVCAIFEELSPSDATNELRSKQSTMAQITRKGILLCVTLYIGIGLFGFLDFAYATGDNILNNYCIKKTHDSLMTAASVFVAVAVVVAFPFNILPARVTLKLILERLKRRRQCAKCFKFISGMTCSKCLRTWNGTPQYNEVESVLSIEEDEATNSSPTTSHCRGDQAMMIDESNDSVNEPLLGDDRFGDRPHIIPHMSLEGLPMPIEQEEEVYSTESSPTEHFLLTLLLSGSALIVALLIPGISVVFGLMGGTAASIISFILPGMFLLDEENNRPSKRKKLLAMSLVLGGTLIGVLSTGTTIYGLFSGNDDVPVDTCGNDITAPDGR